MRQASHEPVYEGHGFNGPETDMEPKRHDPC